MSVMVASSFTAVFKISKSPNSRIAQYIAVP